VKILFYWWLASAPIVALLLARLGKAGPGIALWAASLFLVLTLDRRAGCLCLDDPTGPSIRNSNRDGINSAEMSHAADAAERDHPARAGSQHAGLLDGPAFR